jgi:hypothetical protein
MLFLIWRIAKPYKKKNNSQVNEPGSFIFHCGCADDGGGRNRWYPRVTDNEWASTDSYNSYSCKWFHLHCRNGFSVWRGRRTCHLRAIAIAICWLWLLLFAYCGTVEVVTSKSETSGGLSRDSVLVNITIGASSESSGDASTSAVSSSG